ncbi:hypothetical protein [Bosea massiliensis]
MTAPAVVSTPEHKAQIGELVVPMARLMKRLDDTRAEAVRPHLQAQRETNGWFNDHATRISTLKTELEARATAYDRAVIENERKRREEEAAKALEEEKRQTELAALAAANGDLAGSAAADEKAEQAAIAAASLEGPAPKAADVTRVRSGGVVGSSRTEWKGEIIDIDNLDVVKLRPYLKRDDLQKALNAYVRTGGRECAGAVIKEDVKASFR